MLKIELVPDTSHCIETIARQEYWNLIQDYIRTGKGSSDFEKKVDILRGFLETADFRSLRKKSDYYLLKGQKIKFIIYQERGETKYNLIHD